MSGQSTKQAMQQSVQQEMLEEAARALLACLRTHQHLLPAEIVSGPMASLDDTLENLTLLQQTASEPVIDAPPAVEVRGALADVLEGWPIGEPCQEISRDESIELGTFVMESLSRRGITLSDTFQQARA